MCFRKDYGLSVRNGPAGRPPMLKRFAIGKLMNKLLGDAKALITKNHHESSDLRWF